MSSRLDWERDGRDWPNRAASRFVRAGGLRWHVQEMGPADDGTPLPVCCLVHGTGAATHSWRDLMPLLAPSFRVVAMDLPGHGFTDKPSLRRLSLPAMAQALTRLLDALDASPTVVVGHSAGAAILARMCLDGFIKPELLVSVNGAFLPFQGVAGKVFKPAAQLMAINPLVPRLFAKRARDPAVLERLVGNTGSKLDAAGIEFYGRLAANHRHVAGALGMMAAWELAPLASELPKLTSKLLLIVGARDRTVSPAAGAKVQKLVDGSRLVSLAGLGHLAHEEDPGQVETLICDEARRLGLLPVGQQNDR